VQVEILVHETASTQKEIRAIAFLLCQLGEFLIIIFLAELGMKCRVTTIALLGGECILRCHSTCDLNFGVGNLIDAIQPKSVMLHWNEF
jgi:hypothetical protein